MISAPQLRFAAALAASLLLHAALLAWLRLPPAPPPAPAGSRLNLLLIPLPGERRAAAEEVLPPRVPGSGERRPGVIGERKAPPPRAPAAEAPARRLHASVSAGPISPPAAPPVSRLADASAYLAAERLSRHPRFASPFEMNFPRRALEEGRRGVVIVQLLIDEKGRVVEALAAPEAPPDFAEAALAGLRAARFTPAEAGGRPVKARAYFAVSFVIE